MGSRQQKLRNDHNLSQGKKASKDRGERTQGLRTSTGRTARDEGVIPSAQNVGNGVCSWRWRSRAKKVWSGAGGWMQSPGMSGSRLWRFGRTGAEKEKVEGSVKDPWSGPAHRAVGWLGREPRAALTHLWWPPRTQAPRAACHEARRGSSYTSGQTPGRGW